MGNFCISAAAILGLSAEPVFVEADIASGLPKCNIVGLPDAAVQEARDRVRAAIKNSDLPYPRTHVTVNLAPAEVKKQGPSYDLAIALAVLAAEGHFSAPERLNATLFFGELALDGALRSARGALVAAMAAKRLGYESIVVAKENADEAGLVDGIAVLPARSLKEVVAWFAGETLSMPAGHVRIGALPEGASLCLEDMQTIRGQEPVKRALEIAAAGGHNVLLSGAPGSGKTLLARALPSILPALTFEESLDITMIHSVAGVLDTKKGLVDARPFRAPHHSSSGTALVGGGAWPKPGEISLAHRGVLFLDEFPEFSRSVLENLRQPLEDGIVTIARAAGTVEFPARFMLVGAMNPCPCGYLYDNLRKCTCTPGQITKYQQRLSGPLLDRIDLAVDVPRVEFDKLTGRTLGESSTSIRQRVQEARNRQEERYKTNSRCRTNAELRGEALHAACALDEESTRLLKHAVERLALSARGFTRILRVARTIADLARRDRVVAGDIAEALQYRPKSA